MKTIPLSPLQLKQHFFTLLSVRANPNGSADAPTCLDPSISFQKSNAAPNLWSLGLSVSLTSAKAEAPFAYEVEIQVHGLVEVHENFPTEKREQLAAVNGLGLLYSAAREMLLNITARGPHRPLCLPTLNFNALVAQQDPSTSVEPPPPASTELLPNLTRQ